MIKSIIDGKLYEMIENFLSEDGVGVNDYYWLNLPNDSVKCTLKFKTKGTVLAGLPYFFAVFNCLLKHQKSSESSKSSKSSNCDQNEELLKLEGKVVGQGDSVETLEFSLPFNVALTGERLALNLLQRASSVATITNQFTQKANALGIAILETRKTTPGLRSLEKYAVRVGGGHNHRFTQVDMFMVKDNHKYFFGGLKNAYQYFKSMQSFYTPILVEIHDLSELQEAINLKVKHVMLDNFTPDMVKEALMVKPRSGNNDNNFEMSYELSGGINLGNIDNYLFKGVDAISIGSLTSNSSIVDISLKYHIMK
ncbi:MAG: carboxylating nicotinate-nucleotide diphosphorylase [Oligoflexia bacterium]|nr:carboxylating nicotinate-nucleotide diphosphorylase [Oligoflexia bacterium]